MGRFDAGDAELVGERWFGESKGKDPAMQLLEREIVVKIISKASGWLEEYDGQRFLSVGGRSGIASVDR